MFGEQEDDHANEDGCCVVRVSNIVTEGVVHFCTWASLFRWSICGFPHMWQTTVNRQMADSRSRVFLVDKLVDLEFLEKAL